MSQAKKLLPYAVSAMTVLVGFLVLINDVLQYLHHPEWSNPPWAVLFRFGAFVFVAVMVFQVLKMFCHKREA